MVAGFELRVMGVENEKPETNKETHHEMVSDWDDPALPRRHLCAAGALPNLPRFGMTMTLPGAFTNLAWFGRGPHESYWDRKTGAAVGLYESAVWDQYHDYSRPQENGNKTDVRWLALSNDAGTGLLAVGLPFLSTSAHAFLNEDLDHQPGAQRHGIDVKPRDLVTLNLDYKQMGVGGDNSWGAQTHPEYTLPAQPYAYRFRLRPFSADDPPPSVLSRQGF